MWCNYKSCSCKYARPSGLCKEISMWASCEVPDHLDQAKIPISWLKLWAADKALKDKEHSELYKIILKELLPEWYKYWDNYKEEREEFIREKENGRSE